MSSIPCLLIFLRTYTLSGIGLNPSFLIGLIATTQSNSISEFLCMYLTTLNNFYCCWTFIFRFMLILINTNIKMYIKYKKLIIIFIYIEVYNNCIFYIDISALICFYIIFYIDLLLSLKFISNLLLSAMLQGWSGEKTLHY